MGYKRLFWATAENVNGTSLLKITKNPPLDNIESDFHVIFVEKQCFYSISGLIQSPVVSVLYYHMPFSVMMKHKWAGIAKKKLDKVGKLVGGGSVTNGAYPV